jgi:hypothetical protein
MGVMTVIMMRMIVMCVIVVGMMCVSPCTAPRWRQRRGTPSRDQRRYRPPQQQRARRQVGRRGDAYSALDHHRHHARRNELDDRDIEQDLDQAGNSLRVGREAARGWGAFPLIPIPLTRAKRMPIP